MHRRLRGCGGQSPREAGLWAGGEGGRHLGPTKPRRERLEHPGQQEQRQLPGEKWVIILVPRATVGRGRSDTQKEATSPQRPSGRTSGFEDKMSQLRTGPMVKSQRSAPFLEQKVRKSTKRDTITVGFVDI